MYTETEKRGRIRVVTLNGQCVNTVMGWRRRLRGGLNDAEVRRKRGLQSGVAKRTADVVAVCLARCGPPCALAPQPRCQTSERCADFKCRMSRLQGSGALLGVLQGCRGAAGGGSRTRKHLGNIRRHGT